MALVYSSALTFNSNDDNDDNDTDGRGKHTKFFLSLSFY